MGINSNTTPFSIVYDSFLSRVTSDMYMEMDESDTLSQLQNLLINAIPRFEFPKSDIFDYELGSLEDIVDEETGTFTKKWVGGLFHCILSQEEINILSLSMVIEWLGQQLTTTENTRIKYTSSDFKMTSQANHMAKLKVLIDSYKAECIHMQRLYSRRKKVNGKFKSTFGQLGIQEHDEQV